MSETKHTPGPWSVFVSEGILIAKEDDYADGHNQMAITVASRHGLISHNEALANAHLIAAAPEMVEALAPFADALKGNWSHQPDDMEIVLGPHASDLRMKVTLGDLRRARSALSRARGETP